MRLESLNLGYCTAITNARIAHLEGLTQLNSLNRRLTAVTDAGITHLTELLSLNLKD